MTNHTSARLPRVVGLLLISLCAAPASTLAQSGGSGGGQNTSGEPYPHMPSTAPIGVRTGKYLDVPDAAKGPAIPPGKAYRLQKLGTGLYMITDNVYQSMFLVYDRGVVDVVFPGGMPWRRFALAKDIQGYFAQVEKIRQLDWETLVGGHVARTGTHADVGLQAEFNRDVQQAAAQALTTTKLGVGLNPLDQSNPWAVFDNYIDRVCAECVNTLTPKWATRLAAFDVYIWDQSYAMEQSLRIE